MAAAPPSDFRQHLEVETPEHVVLDLEIAGFGSRVLAALLDRLLLVGLTAAAVGLALLAAAAGIVPRGGWFAAIPLLIVFAVWNGYFILFEGLRGGQTPGKRWVGLRVVRDTGHPVTLGDAAVRDLLRAADFLPPPYLIGMLLTAFHPRAKRLGDLVAGTVVVRDRPLEAGTPRVTRASITPDRLAAPQLTEAEFRLLSGFAERAGTLAAEVRERLAARLAGRLTDRLPERGGSLAERLIALHAAEAERRHSPLASRGGAAGSLADRQSGRWREFHALAERAAREGLDGFRPDELPDFAARYREIAADLARARTYDADAATIARLERLVAAGHNALYRDERKTWRDTWTLVTREFPAAVLAERRAVLIAFLLFAAPAAAGYRLIRDRPALAEELVPETMLRRAAAGRTRAAQGKTYVEVDWDARPAQAAFIITNNVRIAFICFAGGIFLGVGSLVLLAYNGLALGVFAGHFANQGLLGYLLEFVVGHGVLELSAIWIAGAAGFLLGYAVVAPGDLSRADALVTSGRTALRMVGMSAVLLAVAGTIEGFLSVSGAGLAPRALVSGASVLLLAVYLANGLRALTARAASSAFGSPAPRSPAGWTGSPGRAAPR
ncbi:MAG TPA: stage II sporulation protein M [Gemmatimonadales bacterium]|nr:stage II sporulation protein M [Gemmatimonadales bacterium]